VGAGDFPAGDTPAGFDPAQDPGRARAVRYPAAIQLDGASGDYLLDANGRYIESHPVDQRVALKMLTINGSIASSPDTGSLFRKMPRMSPDQRVVWCKQEVKRVLADDVKAGDISIDLVEVDTANAYATMVRLTYTNLRTRQQKTV
jgi:hypothetical protein